MHKIPNSMLDDSRVRNPLVITLATYIRTWPDRIGGVRSQTTFTGFSLRWAAKHLDVNYERIIGRPDRASKDGNVISCPGIMKSLEAFYRIHKRGRFNVYEALDLLEEKEKMNKYFLLPDEVFRCRDICMSHKLLLICCFRIRKGKTLSFNNKAPLPRVLSKFSTISLNRVYELMKGLTAAGYLIKANGTWEFNPKHPLVEGFVSRFKTNPVSQAPKIPQRVAEIVDKPTDLEGDDLTPGLVGRILREIDSEQNRAARHDLQSKVSFTAH